MPHTYSALTTTGSDTQLPTLTPSAPSLSGMQPEPVVVTSSPSVPVHLITARAGHVYDWDGEDPFTPVRHRVVRCTQPPTMLSVGLRVIIEGVEGKLKEVYGTKNRRIRFLFRPNDRRQVFSLVEVPRQFTRLPWHWQAWLGMRQLVRLPGGEDLEIEML